MIIGWNMAFRRNVVDVGGGFDVALGPGTKSGAVSEDLDFVYRVCNSGLNLSTHRMCAFITIMATPMTPKPRV